MTSTSSATTPAASCRPQPHSLRLPVVVEHCREQALALPKRSRHGLVLAILIANGRGHNQSALSACAHAQQPLLQPRNHLAATHAQPVRLVLLHRVHKYPPLLAHQPAFHMEGHAAGRADSFPTADADVRPPESCRGRLKAQLLCRPRSGRHAGSCRRQSERCQAEAPANELDCSLRSSLHSAATAAIGLMLRAAEVIALVPISAVPR